jgi:DNA-binding MarR family transcriptional regulator
MLRMAERPRGDNVLLQMFRTGHAVRELMLEAVEGTGITADEYAVLGLIGAMGSVSPTDLAARLRVPPTTISRHAARMVDSGLARRVPNPDDGRSYLLELTDPGRKTVRTIAPRIRSLVERLAEVTNVKEIEAALVDLEQAAKTVVDSAARR